jgi:hypothetical protein
MKDNMWHYLLGVQIQKKIKTTNKNKELTSPIRKHHTPPAPLKKSVKAETHGSPIGPALHRLRRALRHHAHAALAAVLML